MLFINYANKAVVGGETNRKTGSSRAGVGWVDKVGLGVPVWFSMNGQAGDRLASFPKLW